ncbi:MAG: aminotransferase class I/II-fold pyridoxal phosphate-dependent enzyme [Marinilabiliales bacterium]|nr:aminotransferase class I/II-fold pyridoxal phosphate-dependent enzyme [Marinilabiliales bacterium]
MTVTKLPTTKKNAFVSMMELAEEFKATNLVDPMSGLPCPNELINMVDKYMRAGNNDFSPIEGVGSLRDQIVSIFNKQNNTEYQAETDLTITAGPSQAMSTAISTFVKEGDEVILFEPVQESYAQLIEMSGGRPIYITLKHPEYRIDWDEVKKTVTTKTKMIVINNPQNPIGQIFSAEDFDQLKRMTNGTRLVILSNETFGNIVYDGHKFLSVASIPELAAKSLVVSSFGALFNINGWGLGYIAGPEKLMSEFRKTQQYQGISVNTPAQYALAEYLKKGQNFKEINAFYQSKRDYFLELLAGSKFEFVPTKSTIYQLLDFSKVSDEPDTDFVQKLVREYKVAVIPYSAFQHEKTKLQLIRICFAKSNQVLEEAAYRLKQVPVGMNK